MKNWSHTVESLTSICQYTMHLTYNHESVCLEFTTNHLALRRVARVTHSTHSWFSSVSVSNIMSLLIHLKPGTMRLHLWWPHRLLAQHLISILAFPINLVFLPGTLVIFIHQSIFSHKYLLNLTLCFLVGSENTLESKTPMLDSSFP